jgi:hypothetical protein
MPTRILGKWLFIMLPFAASPANAGHLVIDVQPNAVSSVGGAGGRAWQRMQVELPPLVENARVDGVFLDVEILSLDSPTEENMGTPVFEITGISSDSDATSFASIETVACRIPVAAGTSRVVRLDVTDFVRGAIDRGEGMVGFMVGALSERAAGSFAIDRGSQAPTLTVIFQPRHGDRAPRKAR